MIRDKLKNLSEAQCVKGACVEEDYACRIIMPSLSRSKSCSFLILPRQNLSIGIGRTYWFLSLKFRLISQVVILGYVFVYSYTNLFLFFVVPQKTWCRSIRSSSSWYMCSGVWFSNREVSIWADSHQTDLLIGAEEVWVLPLLLARPVHVGKLHNGLEPWVWVRYVSANQALHVFILHPYG